MGRVDFVYVRGETGRKIFQTQGATLKLGNVSDPVPRAAHLVAMKVQAMKNDLSRTVQKLADIGFLFIFPFLTKKRFGSTLNSVGCWTVMKRWESEPDRLDLERDLPTTPEDNLAQRRYRDFPAMDLRSYLRFLRSFDPPTLEHLRSGDGKNP
jgi:hypothetical protein